MAQKTLNIPEFKFQIGNKIGHSSGIYIIYDISYSLLTNQWYYRYSYWEGGYEHHCKCSQEYVETNFELIR